MNPNQLNTWLTLGANIGVLVGLALLVLEINHNNVLVRAQIEQSRSQALVDWRRQVATDEDTAELLTRLMSLQDSDKLQDEINDLFTEVEKTRLAGMVSADFYDIENLFAQYQRGLVSDEYWQERIVPVIQERAFLWEQFGYADGVASRRAFRDEINRIRRDPAAARTP